jgi:hypothetical protein
MASMSSFCYPSSHLPRDLTAQPVDQVADHLGRVPLELEAAVFTVAEYDEPSRAVEEHGNKDTVAVFVGGEREPVAQMGKNCFRKWSTRGHDHEIATGVLSRTGPHGSPARATWCGEQR